MGQIRHGSATTTHAVRAAIQRSQASIAELGGTQVTDAMSAKTAVQPRARDFRVQKLTHHRQQVIKRHQQRPAQRHGHGFLRGRKRGLQTVWRMAAIFNAIALAPLPNSLLCRPVALCKNPGGSSLACIAALIFGVVVA